MAITNETLATLDDLRLPDLWALWVEIHGEPTRNPNRKSLIARLRPEIEARLALAALPELVIGDTVEVAQGWDGAGTRGTVKEVIPMPEGGPTLLVEWADGSWTPTRAIRVRRIQREAPAEPRAEAAPAAEPVPEATETSAQEPAAPTTANAALEGEPVGGAAASSSEPEQAAAPVSIDVAADTPANSPAAAPGTDADGGAPTPTATPEEKKLSKMTVAELQIRYREVIGRDTGSTNKAYLVWKLREAAKGRIPVGPRTAAHREGPAPDMMVLPLRMEREVVEAMDEAWKRLGIKNRMDLFRTALRTCFEGAGEADVAQLITRGA